MKARGKVPSYPRPVSPLIAEPVHANKGKSCLHGSSDSSSDGEGRAAKRSRIERLGEQYLRGDGLYIMSASLRGPLNGWNNPWLRRKRNDPVEKEIILPKIAQPQVPETVHREQVTVLGGSLKSPDTRHAREAYPSIQEKPRIRPEDSQSWLKKIDVGGRRLTLSQYDSPTPTPYEHSRGKSSSLSLVRMQLAPKHLRKASTSHETPPVVPEQALQHEILGPTPILSTADTKLLPTAYGAHVRQTLQPKRVSLTRTQILKAATSAAVAPSSISQMPAATVPLPPDAEGAMRPMRNVSPRLARLNSKRGSAHTVPPSTHLPEFDYRHAAEIPKPEVVDVDTESRRLNPTRPKKPRKINFTSSVNEPPMRQDDLRGEDTATGPLADIPANLPEGIVLKLNGQFTQTGDGVDDNSTSVGIMPPPSLSTQTSYTNATNQMPSAQVVSIFQPPPTESDNSTAGKMLELTKESVEKDEFDPSAILLDTVLSRDENEEVADGTGFVFSSTSNMQHMHYGPTSSAFRRQSKAGIIPFSSFKSPPLDPARCDLDTQQLLAAITPLGFSTVKKNTFKSNENTTPAKTTRRKARRVKNRPSFASGPIADATSSGSSQGSIKLSMKVSKAGLGRESGKEGSQEQLIQPCTYSMMDLNMETSEEGASIANVQIAPEVSSSLREGGQPHKAGLISSGPVSSALPLTTTAVISSASGQQQDAQQPQNGPKFDGQNGVEGDEDFNLTSAMDDLGSFLGAWDADKEARELGVASSRVRSRLKFPAVVKSSVKE